VKDLDDLIGRLRGYKTLRPGDTRKAAEAIEEWKVRAEKAEAWAAEIHQSMEDQHERNADYQEKLEARAEKAEAALAIMQNWYGLKEQGQ
jgi:predicted S18 family serine protease